MTNFVKTSFAAALIAGAAFASPAIAQDQGEPASMSVQYSDLDLSTEQGQDRLHSRLRRAAQYVCGMDIRDAGSRLPSREARACYAEKVASFEVQIASLAEEQAERRV